MKKNKPNTKKKKPGIGVWGWPAWIIAITFALDQISKIIIDRFCKIGWSKTIIPGLFNLVHLQNKGAAWGIFSQHTWLLAVISTIAFLFILLVFRKMSDGSRLTAFSLALLEGGIAGNMVDRIFRAAVIDFLDFYIGPHHWPAFNIADSAICISIALLLLMQFFSKKKEPQSKSKPPKSKAATK